jgi:hypothetical protein
MRHCRHYHQATVVAVHYPLDLNTVTTTMSGARRETTGGVVDAILSNDLSEVVTSLDTFRPTPEELTEYLIST